ncbi:DUF5953 family protein [Corallococcus sp. BB11-1]|uniref:DUF5953 family protein n=1 Tax=Corallococcus sp. BB11-1 TaxID=2996783 RepID=UPI0022717D77|nr:DUF5953 family protein [Corallococcus sp. BB11-1]MCY1033986.1 DUF5953 family protein [Corallococcus sp. BB11-1]
MPATHPSQLGIIVHGPAIAGNAERPLVAVHGMERVWPGLRLEWRISDEGKPIPLPRRDAWVAEGQSDEPGLPLLCNGDERDPVTISGWERPSSSSPGGQPQFEIHVSLPLATPGLAAIAADVLEAVAEGALSFWGHATPFNAGVEISGQTRHPVRKPGIPPRGLPALKFPEKLRLPEIPQRLGWMNYWSSAAARAIGFPDPARDADLLSRSRRTATGGWVVQLTEAPLDLDNPAHLTALLRAYERFPEIGGRSTL